MTLRTAPKPIFIDFEGVIGEWVSDTTPPTSYSGFLELESLEISVPTQDTVKLIGRRTSTLGLAIDSQNRVKDSTAEIVIKANTFHPALMALAMGGSVSEATQTTATVTDELVTTVLDVWVPLANNGLSTTAISLKTGADAAVTAEKYEVDTELGMIRAIHAGAVGVGMKLTYSKAARTWEEYQAGAASSQYCHIMGKCTNQISKQVGMLDIWRANLAPDGKFVIPSGEKHFQGGFKGDLITPTVAIRGAIPTRPWRFRDRTA